MRKPNPHSQLLGGCTPSFISPHLTLSLGLPPTLTSFLSFSAYFFFDILLQPYNFPQSPFLRSSLFHPLLAAFLSFLPLFSFHLRCVFFSFTPLPPLPSLSLSPLSFLTCSMPPPLLSFSHPLTL